MLTVLKIKPKVLFSNFVKKMAENVAKDSQMAARVQYSAMNELYSIEHEAKLRQKVDL
jgi:hypothetical protein